MLLNKEMLKALIQRIKLERPKVTVEEITHAIDKGLEPRDRDLLSLRLPWSQAEVGRKWKLTRERIRAIEARTIDRILSKIP